MKYFMHLLVLLIFVNIFLAEYVVSEEFLAIIKIAVVPVTLQSFL